MVSLADLGNLGEFLGALGVIASLIYLALQIRQNTKSLRASAFHDATSRSADLTRAIAEQRDLARVYRTGLAGIDQLEDEDDLFRFVMLLSTVFRQYEDLFFQHRAGNLTSESWEAWRFSLRSMAANPGFQPFWDVRRLAFSETFRHFVDAELDRGDPPPTVAELIGRLKDTV